MEVYKLVRTNRTTGRETLITRFKADDYDAAITFAENIEVLPGIFGSGIVKPDADMILLMREES